MSSSLRSVSLLQLVHSGLLAVMAWGDDLGGRTGADGKSRSTKRAKPARHELRAGQVWWLDLPAGQRFDASALLLHPERGLLTVNDRGPMPYQVGFRDGTNAASLTPVAGWFTPAQFVSAGLGGTNRFDCEGLARDEQGRIYLCDESRRRVLRFDPAAGRVEPLVIDWAPAAKFFSRTDVNASFEGIAVGGGRLWLANEREVGRVVVVDLATLKVTDSFQVAPPGVNARDIHYSDLCWFEGELWVLLRESRCVLRINPSGRRVLAEYGYAAIETAPEHAYQHPYPYGFVEGLAVDRESIWLVTDNNGFPRVKDKKDRRPVLFQCRRPDVK